MIFRNRLEAWNCIKITDCAFSCLPTLVTFSRNIRMITAKYIPSRIAQQLANYLTEIVNAYTCGGFLIDLVLMDMEFEKVRYKLEIIEVNTTAAREHVPEIERQICLIKERVRCTTSDFPSIPSPDWRLFT